MIEAYILEGREVKHTSFLEWAHWFEKAGKDGSRIIAKTDVGDQRVSTVFIGLSGELFETMIFGGRLDQYQKRCDTYDEALAQHAEAVEVAQLLPKDAS